MNNVNNVINVLDSNWVIGFIDAEGCFNVSIVKNVEQKVKWRVQPRFIIGLHNRDKDLICKIKFFFNNVGIIWEDKNFIHFCVTKISDILNVIVPHFNKYPLISKKQKDFLVWKEIV